MKKRHAFALICISAVTACRAPLVAYEEAELKTDEKELIVLAAPPDGDRYYANVAEDIFKFHIAFAKQIEGRDNVLVLTGQDHYAAYVKALGKSRVMLAQMQDIWMRDFSPSNAVAPVLFRYTAEGQGGGRTGKREAGFVQKKWTKFASNAGVQYAQSRLLNDGGNYVDDYASSVVISKKFLRDNNINEAQGRKAIRKKTGAKNVAFIEADEQGGLEHADGVAAFIGENTLVINSYPQDTKYATMLRIDLEKGLPGVTTYEIITPYDGSQIYDKRFGSACGLYTNMLVTPKHIYFPQFGIPEDAIALAQITKWTDRKIIPVNSNQVCQMGGGVRCMSWQLRGENASSVLRAAARSNAQAKKP